MYRRGFSCGVSENLIKVDSKNSVKGVRGCKGKGSGSRRVAERFWKCRFRNRG